MISDGGLIKRLFGDEAATLVKRVAIGSAAGAVLCLAAGVIMSPGMFFGAPIGVSLYIGSALPEWLGSLLSFLLWLIFGALTAASTVPFADEGRALIIRTLAHFASMCAVLSAWVLLNFGERELMVFLVPLALLYALIWLGRLSGWLAEAQELREKLGLKAASGVRELAPHIGFAALLCLVTPLALKMCDPPDVPILTAALYPWLLLPVSGIVSGWSLGRRRGFRSLYPISCAVFALVYASIAAAIGRGFSLLFPIEALIVTLIGSAAGAAVRRRRSAR